MIRGNNGQKYLRMVDSTGDLLRGLSQTYLWFLLVEKKGCVCEWDLLQNETYRRKCAEFGKDGSASTDRP